jgi:hypothetical protein
MTYSETGISQKEMNISRLLDLPLTVYIHYSLKPCPHVIIHFALDTSIRKRRTALFRSSGASEKLEFTRD